MRKKKKKAVIVVSTAVLTYARSSLWFGHRTRDGSIKWVSVSVLESQRTAHGGCCSLRAEYSITRPRCDRYRSYEGNRIRCVDENFLKEWQFKFF